MSRIAVTGGLGFIGRHLCRRLPAGILVIDNFHTGLRENLRADQELITADVRRLPEDLPSVDGIYHLACPAAPEHYQRDPLYTFTTAVEGTHQVLKWAARCTPPARVVIASTSEVYGDPEVAPQPETYLGAVSTTSRRASYDESKRAGETLAWIYRQRGLDVRVARIFNVIGSFMREDDGRALPNFIKQARAGQPLTIYGHGEQTRSFCHVDDLVEGLLKLLAYEAKEPWIFNLGNPEEITIKDFASMIATYLNKVPRFLHRPLPENDPRQRCPDISRAKQYLGWDPRISLTESLKKILGDN